MDKQQQHGAYSLPNVSFNSTLSFITPMARQAESLTHLPSATSANDRAFVRGQAAMPLSSQALQPNLNMVAELASSRYHQMVQSRTSNQSVNQVPHGGRTTMHTVASYSAATGLHPTFSAQNNEGRPFQQTQTQLSTLKRRWPLSGDVDSVDSDRELPNPKRLCGPFIQNTNNSPQAGVYYPHSVANTDLTHTSGVVQNGALWHTGTQGIARSQSTFPTPPAHASTSGRISVPQVSRRDATVPSPSLVSQNKLPNHASYRPLTDNKPNAAYPSSEGLENLRGMLAYMVRNHEKSRQEIILSDFEKLWPMLGSGAQQKLCGYSPDQWRYGMERVLTREESKDKYTLSEERLAVRAPSGHSQQTDPHDGDVKKDKGKGREILTDIPASTAPQVQCDTVSQQDQEAAGCQLVPSLQFADERQPRPRPAHRVQPEFVQGSSRGSEYKGKRDTANVNNAKKTVEADKATGRKATGQRKNALPALPVVRTKGPRTKCKMVPPSLAPSVPVIAAGGAMVASGVSKPAKPQRSGASFVYDGAFTFGCSGTLAAEQSTTFTMAKAGASTATTTTATTTTTSTKANGGPLQVSQTAGILSNYTGEGCGTVMHSGANSLSNFNESAAGCSGSASANAASTASVESNPSKPDESEWINAGFDASIMFGLPPLHSGQDLILMGGAEYDFLSVDHMPDYCGDDSLNEFGWNTDI